MVLDGIYSVALGARPDVWLESVFLGYIDTDRKQVGKIMGDAHIVEKIYPRTRLELDENIDIAGRRTLAARQRPKKRRMAHTALAKRRGVGAEHFYDMFADHSVILADRQRKFQRAKPMTRKDFVPVSS